MSTCTLRTVPSRAPCLTARAGAQAGAQLSAWQVQQLQLMQQQRAAAPGPSAPGGQAAANAHSFTCEVRLTG